MAVMESTGAGASGSVGLLRNKKIFGGLKHLNPMVARLCVLGISIHRKVLCRLEHPAPMRKGARMLLVAVIHFFGEILPEVDSRTTLDCKAEYQSQPDENPPQEF